MQVIIPLAGKGTRLRPHTHLVPKPLLKVAGRPVMDWVMDRLEGLEVSAPELQQYVRPISVAVILMLFAVQWSGTRSVGRIFGPVMAAWFLSIGLLGLLEIVRHPFVLLALSPTYAATLCLHHELLAFIVLGSVVLCVTGAEALYADMGHFGRDAIRAA